jgi:serine/threonine protein kinase
VVYRAEEVGLGGRPVALKLLSPALVGDPAFRERFLREMRVAAAIDHPNIVPVYRAGDEQGRLYIAMRYVDALVLRRVLLHRPTRGSTTAPCPLADAAGLRRPR